MDIKDWFKFTDDLKRDFPEAEAAINRETQKIMNQYNELRVNASIQAQFGTPVDPEQIIADKIDHNLPEFEKKFFAHYEEWSIDTPEQNRFDSVRHLYPETEFERGDDALNSYAERFQNLKDEHKQKETSKESALEDMNSVEIPDASKEYDTNINVEFGSTTQKYLRTSFRDTKEDLTANKDIDMDRE
jgi:hypothetical protein